MCGVGGASGEVIRVHIIIGQLIPPYTFPKFNPLHLSTHLQMKGRKQPHQRPVAYTPQDPHSHYYTHDYITQYQTHV